MSTLVIGSVALPSSIIANSSLLPDDSFFYLKIAANVAAGRGLTFDGVNPTNGFHYGWVGLLSVLLGGLPAGDHVSVVRTALLVHTALYGALGVVLLRNLRPAVASFVLALWLPLVAMTTLGMESSLLAFAAAFYAGAVARGARAMVPPVLIGAFVVLARHDAGVLLAILPLFVRGARRRAALLALAGGAVTWIAIARVNLVLFGHAATISSHLKLSWQLDNPAESWLFDFGASRVARYLLTVPVGLAVALHLWRQERDEATLGLVGLNVYAVAYTGALIGWGSGANFSWYYALTSGVFLLTLATALSRCARRVMVLVAASASVALCWRALRMSLADAGYMTDIAALQGVVAPDERVFMIDQSGRVGFWSERSVVNGDGLVNGWAYQEAIRAGTLESYFDSTGIDWILTDPKSSVISDGRVHVRVPGWRGSFFGGGRALGWAPVQEARLRLWDSPYLLVPRLKFTFVDPG